jgi:hypothetical protein
MMSSTPEEAKKGLLSSSIITSVLLRTFTSQANIQFFENILRIINSTKSDIREFKQRLGEGTPFSEKKAQSYTGDEVEGTIFLQN